MTSLTYNASIDQGARLVFQENFHEMAQQTESHLVGAGVVKFLPADGKTNMLARIGRIELTEVNTRNPDKQYADYSIDNRQFTKRRFTKTIQIDAKYDINELIKDPTSDILTQLNYGKERVIDRIAIEAATGSVLVGAPDAAPSSISAATDGVLTVDATAGLTYEIVEAVVANFINNDLPYTAFKGSVMCLTGSENTSLMNEIEFINNLYMTGQTAVADGKISQAACFMIEFFAGSVNGGITVLNPIIPEASTTRSCVVMAPLSIAMAMELADLGVEKSSSKVNSWDITIDFWINAMRIEGARVQIITTTI